MKKIILINIIFINTLFALSIGDNIKSDISNKLKLNTNKVYIVDFFASWCSSCKIELPLISKLNNSIDKNKYKILGINSDKDKSLGKTFVKNLDLNFDIYYDDTNEIISYFEPIGVPAIYYIKNNKIINVVYGAVDNIDKKIITDLKDLGE